MNEVSEAYVLGLLSDLERDVPKALDEIRSAGARASLVDAELTRLLQRQEVAEEREGGLRLRSGGSPPRLVSSTMILQLAINR